MRWVKTSKGKVMPIDDEPSSAGRFVIDDDDEDHHHPRVRFLGEKEDYTGERFTSHFATCPHASQHRKKKS
jgi:hypothetical protein